MDLEIEHCQIKLNSTKLNSTKLCPWQIWSGYKSNFPANLVVVYLCLSRCAPTVIVPLLHRNMNLVTTTIAYHP